MSEPPPAAASSPLALIAPLLPWRGGIARHSTRLAQALRARVPLHVASFRRLYPAWLYPGASCREPEPAACPISDATHDLDALSPRSWWRCARRLRAGGVRATVLPWWTVALAPCSVFLARHMRRAGPVVFLCHNVADHDAWVTSTWLSRHTLRHASAFLVQSPTGAEHLRALCPGKTVLYHPHPAWDEPVPAAVHPLPRRARLELLFFGFVRPYKGLDVLVDALERLARPEIALTVAGEWWRRDHRLQARIRALPHAELCDRYVTSDEADALFARADWVVLPYRNATGSGVAALALRHGKPMLATRAGGLPDLVQAGDLGRLVPPGDATALAATLAQLLQEPSPCPAAGEPRRGTTWDSLAETVLTLCRQTP